MAYETLQEATGSGRQVAVQLFCAVRSMFELFCSVFPIFHQQNIEALPQFTGELAQLDLYMFWLNCSTELQMYLRPGPVFIKKLK